jgi:replicative DNA helicase
MTLKITGLSIPHDTDAEIYTLGAMMMENEYIDVISSVITAESFHDVRHATLFSLIMQSYEKHQACDLMLIRGLVKDMGLSDKIGGLDYITNLYQLDCVAALGERYAHIVKDKHTLRMIARIGVDCLDSCNGSPDVNKTIADIEEKIFTLSHEKSFTIQSSFEIMHDVLNRIESIEVGDVPHGLNTGFVDIDSLTGGLQKGEVTIIAARPSQGKTSLSLNLINHATVIKGEPCLFFSLEMSSIQLINNLLSISWGINCFDLRNAKFTDSQINEKAKETAKVSNAPLYVDSVGMLSLSEIRSKSRKMVASKGIKYIILDYLQLMDGPGENRQQAVSAISRGLKALAIELQIPIVALSQLNRGVEYRAEGTPKLSDLRESGAIEQDADVVMLLNRSKESPNIAQIDIAKNRNGATGGIKLSFVPECLRFQNHYEGKETQFE